jgi:hypothetical protein
MKFYSSFLDTIEETEFARFRVENDIEFIAGESLRLLALPQHFRFLGVLDPGRSVGCRRSELRSSAHRCVQAQERQLAQLYSTRPRLGSVRVPNGTIYFNFFLTSFY